MQVNMPRITRIYIIIEHGALQWDLTFCPVSHTMKCYVKLCLYSTHLIQYIFLRPFLHHTCIHHCLILHLQKKGHIY